jgi:hypothetical protein
LIEEGVEEGKRRDSPITMIFSPTTAAEQNILWWIMGFAGDLEGC